MTDFPEGRSHFCVLVGTELRKLSKSGVSSPSSSLNVICEEGKLTSSLSLAGMKFGCGGGFGSTVPSGRMLPICEGTLTSSLSLGGVKFDCGGVGSAVPSGRMVPE